MMPISAQIRIKTGKAGACQLPRRGYVIQPRVGESATLGDVATCDAPYPERVT